MTTQPSDSLSPPSPPSAPSVDEPPGQDPSPLRDDVYRDPRNQIGDFVFDKQVAGVFTDMIRRSVPGYEVVVPVTGLLAARHLSPGGVMYDLGCSLGAGTLATLRQIGDTPCHIVAVDSSQAMLDRAARFVRDPRVSLKLDDVRSTPIDGADVVLMNYTLQFIEPAERLHLLERIHAGLAPDGVLILSEKVHLDDPLDDAYVDEVHAAFKRANGYSDLEVSQKRAALEAVMIVDSLDTQRRRLAEAGFRRILVWFRCLNWASLIAWP